jgi:hypothetical protein
VISINLSIKYCISINLPIFQGSVLGPLLFSLYTAPLLDIFQHHDVSVHFYADDTQFWVPFDHRDHTSEEEAEVKLPIYLMILLRG